MKRRLLALLMTLSASLALTTAVTAQGGFPFAAGSVTAVDTKANTITLTPRFGNNGDQTIHVADGAQIVTQATAAVGDLKVGDQITVQGVPTSITASDVISGQLPTFFPARPGGNGNGGNAAGGTPASQATASAVGKVTKTDPLTISVGTDVSLVIKLAADAKVTMVKTITLDTVKAGDQIIATGQNGDDGTLNASSIGINLSPAATGGGGRGGFGFGRRAGSRGTTTHARVARAR